MIPEARLQEIEKRMSASFERDEVSPQIWNDSSDLVAEVRRLREAGAKVWDWSCGRADLATLREGLDALNTEEPG